MGKSDPHVLKFYSSNLDLEKEYSKVGLFGQITDNMFTSMIKCNSKEFFDIQLDNWNINDFPYPENKKFDLIVCTRCAYFSKEPQKTIESFLDMLKKDGLLFIDWGLGDHWRFDNYKVGWLKDGEQEYAYQKENYLWSTIWHHNFYIHPAFKDFSKNITKFNYLDFYKTINTEVPSVLDLNVLTANKINVEYNMLSLWQDNPQLYILLKMRNI